MRTTLRTVLQARPDAWLAAVIVACIFASGSERRPAALDEPQIHDIARASATIDAPDVDGNQRVNVTLTIAPDWHVFANPIGSTTLTSTPTTVRIRAGRQPLDARVEYPEGTLVKDAAVGECRIYQGQVTIPATIKRGDSRAPLTVHIRLQACNDKRQTCLLPATITVNVP